MTNTENSVRCANGTGYLPTRESCKESEEYKKMVEEDPNLQTIVDQVQYSTYKTPFIPQYQEAKEIFANEIQKCILEDNYTPEQAVSSMEERDRVFFCLKTTCQVRVMSKSINFKLLQRNEL